jgi:hypothetical protein
MAIRFEELDVSVAFFPGGACIAGPEALGSLRSWAPARFQSLGEKCGLAPGPVLGAILRSCSHKFLNKSP